MPAIPLLAAAAAGLIAFGAHAVQPVPAATQACRLSGVEHEAQCGVVQRPLDPSRPDGPRIDVHFAVLPALARNKLPDPVFFLAGGPGQSAIGLAGPLSRQLARLSNRRDIVLVDQRGTGRSAPLVCDEPSPVQPLAEQMDQAIAEGLLRACLERLQKLPHGDLRQFHTAIASQDLDAVRAALGVERVNLVGGSYGTRAALDYQRQFPQRVRRLVIDGVAPPDMVLPHAFATDNEAALQSLLAACAAEPACNTRHPRLADQLQRLLAALPRKVALVHPVTGQREELMLNRVMALSMLRQALYAPALASALPLAITEGAAGRFDALLGLGMSISAGRRHLQLAGGMHFAVVCAEDGPRLGDAPPAAPTFGDVFASLYARVCSSLPRAEVPADFYKLPQASGAALVTSGGIDPVTPPRHGERVARALGSKARHVVVPNAGHGVIGIGCMRDVVFRFIDAADDLAALKVDTTCAEKMPRPPAFSLPGGVVAQAAGATR